MKRLLLTILALTVFNVATSQELRFGVKAGFLVSSFDGAKLHEDDLGRNVGRNNLYSDYYYLGYDSNASSVGIYAGGLVEFDLIDDFKIQPELTFSIVPGDDGYFAINVPVLLKYSFFKDFYAQAGPAINYAVDGDADQLSPSLNFGASYDLFEDFYTELRIDVGLGGYLGSNINAGVGYRF